MRSILLIGAGKSSSSLIKYFLDHSSEENWKLVVADFSIESASAKTNNHPAAQPVAFDINNEQERRKLISHADLVISMLPAHMHLSVAEECLRQGKNLITASYVSAEMQNLHEDVLKNGLLFLNECGLDPGIDHMSAMEVIDDVHSRGGELISFRSYTGGLVAPESNDNPWGYKFSWNPRNVILAGQGTARYIEEGKYKYIPYNRLFGQIEKIHVDGYGDFDGYANRDSLSYRKSYGLSDIPTMIRGTLRQSPYCSAWNIFVQLGLTDDSFKIEDSEKLSYKEIVEAFLPAKSGVSVKNRISDLAGVNIDSDEMKMVEWTGILSDVKPGIKDASPAQILQHLLDQKWKLKESDKDMIVMQHQFRYIINGKTTDHTSSLVVKGDNSVYTAMAKTVGLPMAIAARLIMNGKIKLKGVQIPVETVIYKPVLEELKKYGIRFEEKLKTKN
jgi:saccharopine dehydrogenase-like NADP-dependent oxidoreductase